MTARQVGQAALGALEQGTGGTAHALGGINYRWTDFAEEYFRQAGRSRPLVPLPPCLFRTFGVLNAFFLALAGKERGLEIRRFADFQYREAFVDPAIPMADLGYSHDNYREALANVIREWISVSKQKGG